MGNALGLRKAHRKILKKSGRDAAIMSTLTKRLRGVHCRWTLLARYETIFGKPWREQSVKDPAMIAMLKVLAWQAAELRAKADIIRKQANVLVAVYLAGSNTGVTNGF